jgi:hypothetical protein
MLHIDTVGDAVVCSPARLTTASLRPRMPSPFQSQQLRGVETSDLQDNPDESN